MPTYQPNIPTGLVNLDVDYQNLRGNFQQLDTLFQVDHLPLTNTTAQKGYHKPIHFVPVSTTAGGPGDPTNYPLPASTPTTAPGYGQLFTAVTNDGNGTDTMLFFKTGFGVLNQLTSNVTTGVNNTNQPLASNAFITYLPGGFILQAGFRSNTAGNPTITYPRPFPNNVLNVQITPVTATTNIGSDTYGVWAFANPNKTSFQIINAGTKNAFAYYWQAIGN